MNNWEMILNDMWISCPRYEVVEAGRFFDEAPLDTIETFRDCSPDIEERVREILGEDIWEYIQEELEWNNPKEILT